MRKAAFCIYGTTKVLISCAVTAQLISAFVVATIDSIIPLLSKSKISSLWSSSAVVQPGLLGLVGNPKVGFLTTLLISDKYLR